MADLNERIVNTTGIEGSEHFPVTENEYIEAVETIASQGVHGAKSANRIDDGTYKYEVANGKVIEEIAVEMAEAQAFDRDAYSRAAKDPVAHVKYFNNWVAKQFHTTTRRNDIRKIIANKGVSVEDFASTIIGTLTEGEGKYSFDEARKLILQAPVKDYSSILGGVPLTSKGIIYAIRDMFNHVKSNNADLTAVEYVSSVPEADIRIALTPKVLNVLDVTELANVFNLEKEALFGRIVVIDADDLPESLWYKVVVYDVKAMGEATRLYEFSQEEVAKGLYMNHYLTIEKAFFFNGLFKAASLNCAEAAVAEKADLVGAATSYTITPTLTKCSSDNAAESINAYSSYLAHITVDEGYTFDDESAVVTITMGGTSIVDSAWDSAAKTISIPAVTGNLVITLTAVQEG